MGREMKAAELAALRDERRSRNRICRLHHHAVRTGDMEATRQFYEDVIGLPLAVAMRSSIDRDGEPTPFLHCFFELGDGSFLAFFQFLPDVYGPADKLPRNPVDHHVAVAVADFVEIEASFGWSSCGMARVRESG